MTNPDAIPATFRKSLIRFALEGLALGAVLGALAAIAFQIVRDTNAVSFAFAWDMAWNLPLTEWVSVGTWLYMIVGGAFAFSVPATLAFWFGESPRWNK